MLNARLTRATNEREAAAPQAGLRGVLRELALQQIPSLFAQLIFLSGLRDDGCTDPVLAKLRQSVFTNWLSLNCEQQLNDLVPYLSALACTPQELRFRSTLLRLCHDIVPEEASNDEVRLFVRKVDAILYTLAESD